MSMRYRLAGLISSAADPVNAPKCIASNIKPRFTKWSQQYGGLVSLKRGSSTILILSDRKIVRELLDRKSSLYSRRPFTSVSHNITQGDHMLVMDYSKTWQLMRKLSHQYFMEDVCEKQHVQVQEAEAVQLMRDYLLNPEQHMLHPKRYSNSIINSIGEDKTPSSLCLLSVRSRFCLLTAS